MFWSTANRPRHELITDATKNFLILKLKFLVAYFWHNSVVSTLCHNLHLGTFVNLHRGCQNGLAQYGLDGVVSAGLSVVKCGLVSFLLLWVFPPFSNYARFLEEQNFLLFQNHLAVKISQKTKNMSFRAK